MTPLFPRASECEDCGQPFELTEQERSDYPLGVRTRCPECACPRCHDLPYTKTTGDQERQVICPDCGRGEWEPDL